MSCYIENQIANYCNDVEPAFKCSVCGSDECQIEYEFGEIAQTTCDDCGDVIFYGD